MNCGAQDVVPHPRGYVCLKTERPPSFEGKLEDGAWAKAPWTEAFVDIEGDRKPPPALSTRSKMLWDDEFFYVAAELEEPNLWATLTEHDSVIFHDNDFEVFIDPDGDNHQYYEYEINALATDWDLRLVKPYRDGGPPLNSWEIPGLRKAVHTVGSLNQPTGKDECWRVELGFPWKVLGEYASCPAPPRPGDQWRVNFSRVEWDLDIVEIAYRKVPNRPEHNWVWSPQWAVDMHRPELWGYVQFEERPTAFRRDRTWATRCRLMAVYWAQKKRHDETGSYAASCEQLGLEEHEVQVRLTEDGYVAELHGLSVRQDSLLSKTVKRRQAAL